MVTGGSQENPLPLKLIFFKHASLAKADIGWYFFRPPVFVFPSECHPCTGCFCMIILYDNFERQQCGTNPSLFPLIQ